MVGRGSSGGVSDIYSKLPDPPPRSGKLPQLEGTERQVNWAKQIRRDIGRDLVEYARTRMSDGRPFGYSEVLFRGKEAMAQDILNSSLVKGTTGALRREKIADQVASYNDVAARITRAVNIILDHKSAKWWIDNRTNQSANYMNEKLKKIIDGK